jgi:membrane fusion protein, multidrug efflux system
MMRALLLVFALLASGCGKEIGKLEDEARPVRVQRVTSAGGGAAVTYPGEVRARYETPLSFRVPGKIASRHVEVGELVKKGRLLARLDPADLQLSEAALKAQLAAAQADVELSASDLKRYQDLRTRNFIAEAELDRRSNAFNTAKARLAQARAQFEQSGNQSSYAVLSADTDGVISAVSAEAGQVVAAGQEVVRLARLEQKEIVISIPEHRVHELARSGQVEVRLWAQPDKAYQGRIREIAPATDPVTRTFTAKVSVASPPPEMRLGMTANVSIGARQGPARILLPLTAVYEKGGKHAMWVVDPKTLTVSLVPVRVGAFAGNEVVVEAGLEPGALVVVAGVHLLRPGQKVRLLDEAK